MVFQSTSKKPKRKGIRNIVGEWFKKSSDSPAPSQPSSGTGSSVALPDTSPLASSFITPDPTVAPTSLPATSIQCSTPLSPTSAPSANTESSGANTPLGPRPITRKLNAVWSGLETALCVLEKSSDVFPPLKSAVGRFIACLYIIQDAAANRGDYESMTAEFKTMAENLNQYVGELGSEAKGGSVAHISQCIEAQVARINEMQNRGMGRRLLESEDKGDVIECYRQIDSLFRQLQSDVSFRTFRNTNEHLVMTLLQRLSAVSDARYNSSYSTTIKRRECTPHTREKVQRDLRAWVNNPRSPKVYWMSGMAGTGKTTIAYSLCKWLEENKQLGASFFCSRASASCRGLRGIIPTIAYQLARYCPAFRSELCSVLKDDPDASTLHVVAQFEKLIQGPLSKVKDAIPEGVIIVMDALDECEDNYGVRLILELLLKVVANLPIKFFMTSRPEPTIREKMMPSNSYSPSVMHLHDIEESIVQEDIKKYLAEALSRMSSPPSQADIDELAKRAGKLFIYAATVVRYIYPDRIHVDSNARLQTMLAIDPKQSDLNDSDGKYTELDKLYSAVLDAAFDRELMQNESKNMQLVLWTVVSAQEPMTITTLGSLLKLSEKQVSSALEPLLSVLHVSDGDRLVSTLHGSFPDYMLDKSRSGKFYCDKSQHNQFLARCCFDIMKAQLRFNICNLASSCVLNKDVPDLDKRVNDVISPALFYASRYWSEHLQQTEASKGISIMLSEFLSQRLLFWMEVMSLRKCIGSGVPMLHQAQIWLSTNKLDDGTQKQASDARIFVTGFAANACSQSTPHIYISALPFCPKSSSVYANYWGRTQGLMNMGGTALKRREAAALAIWKGNVEISSVSFSLDGARVAIASGSDIWVRDAHTGRDIAGPFKGHTDWVNSVAFSSDGARIVSGSSDRTIRVWDSHTGTSVAGPFKGHTGAVNSVAFSPDGTRIVSGSGDWTVRVWGSHTGAPVAGPFRGCTGGVNSVAFSPDGARMVSGSDDRTIQVWDLHTGASVAGPFKGHTDWVNSVAFSPDGTRIVSGSHDCTIRVWESHTGASVAGPFKGHTGGVKSVAFSPDGTRIVSGSYDYTVRVWDSTVSAVLELPEPSRRHLHLNVSFTTPHNEIYPILSHDPHYSTICTSDPAQSSHTLSVLAGSWTLNDDGWVSNNNDQLLFWVTPDLHSCLPAYHNLLNITEQGSLQIEDWNLALGDAWSKCYDSD